ncbi:MAG: RES family NAD+ phosphorylase, partial [Alphaproteobacteria bacterium]
TPREQPRRRRPSASTALPDGPPAPPADLARRRLPIERLDPGARLFRIHRAELAALHFGTSATNRFDDPAGVFGVCYAARSPEGAFAETCLRAVGEQFVTRGFLAARRLCEIAVVGTLRLAALHGPGLAPLGATAAIAAGDYRTAQCWSAAIHAHPAEVDGIAYRANHDNGELSAALFDRCRSSLQAGASADLLADPARLAQLLDRYAVGLG